MDTISLTLGQAIRFGKVGQEATVPVMEVRLAENGVWFEPHPTADTISSGFREWNFLQTLYVRSNIRGIPVNMYHDERILPVLRIINMDYLGKTLEIMLEPGIEVLG